jgi:hypothetical protein
MISSLLGIARRYIILFGLVKFCAGLVIGFGLGVYFLPILTAEKGLSDSELTALSAATARQQVWGGTFTRDLPASDAFHWGEGRIHLTKDRTWLDGSVSPGPDYRLYLTKHLVKTKEGFEAARASAVQVGPIKAFENFSLEIPDGINISDFGAVLVWCEAFSAFITAAEISRTL